MPFHSRSAAFCLLRSHHVLLFRLGHLIVFLVCSFGLGHIQPLRVLYFPLSLFLSLSLPLSPCRLHPVFMKFRTFRLHPVLFFFARKQLLPDTEKLGCDCHTRAPKPFSVSLCVGVQRREKIHFHA